jgi:hypothetical protein
MTGRLRTTFAGLLAISACACSQAEQGVMTAQKNDPVIVLTEGACEATCPIYAMTLHPDGSYVLHAEKFVKSPGVHEGQLGEAAWAKAEATLEDIKFWTLKPEQTTSSLPSCQPGPPVVSITWRTAEGRQKTLNYRVGCGDNTVRAAVAELRSAMSFHDLVWSDERFAPDGSR